jgi:hypothetical protein
MLLDLVPGSVLQGELDLEEEDQRDRTKLMVALDTLNGRYGKGTVHSASTGGTNKGKDWGMKQERRTLHYTTSRLLKYSPTSLPSCRLAKTIEAHPTDEIEERATHARSRHLHREPVHHAPPR